MVSLSDFGAELAQRADPQAVVRHAIERTAAQLVPAILEAPEPLVQYQTDPVGFAVEILGIPRETVEWDRNEGYEGHTWDGTPNPLVAVCEALVAWDDVGVESATGTGKSFWGAVLVLWFLAVWPMSRVFTFAPKEDQLKLYIWKEITRLWPRFQARFPSAELTTLRIRMIKGSDEWGAVGFPVQVKAGEVSSANAQGQHAEHMMLMYEETPGIALPVIEAGENTCTSPHNIRVAWGNPDNQLDALHLFAFDSEGNPRPGVRHVRISALDHPNYVTGKELVPGAVGRKSVWRRRSKYGEDHALFKSRIRGISPSEAKDALIKLEWVRRAQARWADETEAKLLRAQGGGKKALGVDVANSEDGDEAAIARGTGALLESVTAFPCPNANTLGLKVAIEMTEQGIEDEHVGVDGVGVGAGAVNELRGRDRWIRALNGGDGAIGLPDMDERFPNLRSQMAWVLREDLRTDKIALPPGNPTLVRDLITATWEPKNGKIVVESKEDIKKRTPGGRSPNEADAVMYWNFVRPRDAIVSAVPQKYPTEAQRLKRELDRLDELEREHEDGGDRYGGVLRQ